MVTAYGPGADPPAAAAWLRDIGYSPGLADGRRRVTPRLDGARQLRPQAGTRPGLAPVPAALRRPGRSSRPGHGRCPGRRVPAAPAALADALTYRDMTTGPRPGHDRHRRLAKIADRYGPGHPVTGAITTPAPDLTAAAEYITARPAASAKP